MTDNEIDYESLGGSQPLMVSAAAGATAGYFEHIAVYPIDVIKTRMQSLRQGCAPATQNPFTAMQTLIKSEGAKPLARGSGAIAFGCGPAHAIQFLCYENVKTKLEAKKIPFAPNIGGAFGAFFHDIWMNPCEVVKQRLQMKNSPYLKMSYSRIVSQIARTEGFSAFYLSFPTQLVMNLPFSFIHFGIYDSLKVIINPKNEYSPSTNAFCGAVAGGLAAFVTTPLDVVKTVLNTQEGRLGAGVNCDPCPTACATEKLTGGSYVGSWQEAVYKIKEMNPSDPVRPFFRGCWARVISVAPGCALSWLAYEFMKTLLNAENSQKKTDRPVVETKKPSKVASF